MRHRFVRPVNRQRVLDQIVGANRYEIKVLEQTAHHDGSRRNFNHGPQLHRPVGGAPRIQLSLRQFDLRHDAVRFMLVRDHRKQQMHFAKRRRPQNSAQLGAEHGWLRQAPANGAQPQRRVE